MIICPYCGFENEPDFIDDFNQEKYERTCDKCDKYFDAQGSFSWKTYPLKKENQN